MNRNLGCCATEIVDLHQSYPGGISMPPNVVADEVQEKTILKNLNPWVNMATISGQDAVAVNGLIAQALNQGANGLDLRLETAIDMSVVMKGVLTEYLDVRIDCRGWSGNEVVTQKEKLSLSDYPNVRWIGDGNYQQVDIPADDRIDNIAEALRSIDSDHDCDVIVTMSKNLLFEVASLRAIRSMMERRHNASFNIIARYDIEGSNQLGDYDLIEKSYKVMSGILGCADSVLTDYRGDEASRLGLNIHNVLELESGLNTVLDPVQGSYYLEKLMTEIIDKTNL